MAEHKVIVVGAGIAGLASAVSLAAKGIDVTILERASTVGGKLHQRSIAGAAIDSGPTVFTMRWVFDDLFRQANTSLEQELSVHRSQTIARHTWGKGEVLDLYADRERSAQAIGEFAGRAEADRFLKFCDQARTTYRTLERAYIRSERPTIFSMHSDLGLKGLKVLWDLGMFQSLSRSLHRHFKDPRLHQLFSRYATYCGSDPMYAPATLMIIADVEMQGVWVIDGGMSALAQSLAKIAQRLGARIQTDSDVQEIVIQNGKACGVCLGNGETLKADAVIFNGDIAALRNGAVKLSGSEKIFGPAEDDLAKRSLSAMTYAIHAKTSGFGLTHHNLFFQDEYASEFEDIFVRRVLPSKPTVYICAQDRRDDDRPLNQEERLLLLVNAPATGDRKKFEPSEINACEKAIFCLLDRCGLSIERQASNTLIQTPAGFHQMFPATGGALYGHSTHGWMSSFSRQSSASRLPGLYLAGGSVHPGPGVPMAAMSGRLAAETLMAHLGLIRQSGRVVISGGTSMH